MATYAMPLLEIQDAGPDLARRTVCIKIQRSRLGNSKKVNSSQVEVDTDKTMIAVSKFRGVTAECIRKYRKWPVCQ